MSVTIISQPAAFTFAANPIVFALQSNNFLQSQGFVFKGSLQRQTAWPTGTVLNFQFGDESVTITTNRVPDNSGYQIPADSPTVATPEAIVSFLLKNYVLSNYYDISVVSGIVTFTAKQPGTFYNWMSFDSFIKVDAWGADALERPGFKFLFEVFVEDLDELGFTKVYSEKLNSDLPFSGKLTIDIHDILSSALQDDVPNPNGSLSFRNSKSKRRYYCRFAEVIGNNGLVQAVTETEKLHVATGGFSYVGFKTKTAIGTLMPVATNPAKDIFLKQGSRTLRVRTNQPEFLYFINLREDRLLFLKFEVLYADGSIGGQRITSVNMLQYQKYGFAVGYDQQMLGSLQSTKVIKSYDCYLVNADDVQLSEKVTYVMDHAYRESARYFLYSSSLGAFDTFLAYGKSTEKYTLEQEQAESPLLYNYQVSDGSFRSYDVRRQRTYVVNTGWLEKKVFDLLADFYLAEIKFLCLGGQLLPLAVTNKEAGEFKDGTSLIKQDISFTLSFEDYKFTDGDMEGSFSAVPALTGLVHFGSSIAVPTTQAMIKALPVSQDSNVLAFDLNTETGRIFTIALPNWKKLFTVFDRTSEEDLTSEYLRKTNITVDAIAYKIYTMVTAVGYSGSHKHHVVITDDTDYVPVTPPVIVTNLVYFGVSSAKPATAAAITGLAGKQGGAPTSITFSTGTARFFNVAMPATMKMTEAYDQTSEEDITSEYQKNTMQLTINGLLYNVYTMQTAIAYSTVRNHIITLSSI